MLTLVGVGHATDSADAVRQAIQDRWHTRIVQDKLAERIVPLVATDKRPVTMSDLSAANASACLDAVHTAFEAYPVNLVSMLIQKVVLADMIHAWAIRIGGFHAPELIAINCENAAENAVFDADSVHDEIAQLVLGRVSLDTVAWRTFNPPGFKYGDLATYKAELRLPNGRAGTAAMHRNGFVAGLGLTAIENDFETYAERLFGHPKTFAALLRVEPAMRGKARLVMAVYERLAPELSATFQASGLTAAAAE